ncbi:type II toxin-antitoxin system prevent-host-death family antitoxin [Microbacterium sp. NPDC055903]
METLDRSITTRELRDGLAEAVARAAYGGERIGVTKHGKLAAVLIGVEDLELLEELEEARDVVEFRAARAADDGARVSLAELKSELVE